MSQKLELNQQEQLNQLSKKELVEIILAQQKIIEELKIEVEKLKISRNLDSKISSKPPSSDLLSKPEKKGKSSVKKPKRSPGGQLGHQGKTRKGFGRVDRYEVLKAEKCLNCGELLASAKSIKIETNSAAIKPSVTELEEWINSNHPTLNIDETPWSVKGLKES